MLCLKRDQKTSVRIFVDDYDDPRQDSQEKPCPKKCMVNCPKVWNPSVLHIRNIPYLRTIHHAFLRTMLSPIHHEIISTERTQVGFSCTKLRKLTTGLIFSMKTRKTFFCLKVGRLNAHLIKRLQIGTFRLNPK